jgi:hypothetical protein
MRVFLRFFEKKFAQADSMPPVNDLEIALSGVSAEVEPLQLSG